MTIAGVALASCQKDEGTVLQDDCSLQHWEFIERAPVDEGNGYISGLFIPLEDDPSNHEVGDPLSRGTIHNCSNRELIYLSGKQQTDVGRFFAQLRGSSFSALNVKKLAASSGIRVEGVAQHEPNDLTPQTCACNLYYPDSLGATQ